MQNNGQLGIGTRDAVAGERFKTPEWVYGYSDARNGIGYRHDYETWRPHTQRQYENGRLICIGIRAAGIKPPPLRVNRTQAFIDAWRKTRELCGMPHDVTKRMPDADYGLTDLSTETVY